MKPLLKKEKELLLEKKKLSSTDENGIFIREKEMNEESFFEKENKKISFSRKIIREFFSEEKILSNVKRTIALEAVVCVLENSKKYCKRSALINNRIGFHHSPAKGE